MIYIFIVLYLVLVVRCTFLGLEDVSFFGQTCYFIYCQVISDVIVFLSWLLDIFPVVVNVTPLFALVIDRSIFSHILVHSNSTVSFERWYPTVKSYHSLMYPPISSDLMVSSNLLLLSFPTLWVSYGSVSVEILALYTLMQHYNVRHEE